MTTEQAIKLLHRLQDEQFDGEYGEARREALEMAVRALSGDGDTISRQAAIDEMRKLPKWNIMREDYKNEGFSYDDVMFTLEKLPSAQKTLSDGTLQITVDTDISTVDRILLSQSGTHYGNLYYADEARPQRKTGKWILSDDRQWKTCSECGAEIDISMGTGVYVGVDAVSEMRFCPNCGARMDGESE